MATTGFGERELPSLLSVAALAQLFVAEKDVEEGNKNLMTKGWGEGGERGRRGMGRKGEGGEGCRKGEGGKERQRQRETRWERKGKRFH